MQGKRVLTENFHNLQALETVESANSTNNNALNVLDKERNTMSEDPKWEGNFRKIISHRSFQLCILNTNFSS